MNSLSDRIDLAITKGGEVIQLDKGEHILTKKIELLPNTSLTIIGPEMGCNKEYCKITCKHDDHFLHKHPKSDLTLKNVTVVGKYQQFKPPVGEISCIFIDDGEGWNTRTTIENCNICNFVYGIRNAGKQGIGYLNLKMSHIHVCHWGVKVWNGNNTMLTMVDSGIRACGDYRFAEESLDVSDLGGGLFLSGCKTVRISGCALESNTMGILLNNVIATDISTNYFENNRTFAIDMKNCLGISARNLYGWSTKKFNGYDHANRIRLTGCKGIDLSCCVRDGYGGRHGGFFIEDNGGNTDITI